MRSADVVAFPLAERREGIPARLWNSLLFDRTRADRLALAFVLCLTVADALFFATLATQRYLSHHADAFDLGIEDQAMWTTLHGQFFGITLERRLTSSYLGYHVEPISLVGPLLYLIYPSPISLIVFKCVVVALGTVAAYWLARRHLRNPLLGTIFAVAYALFPGLEAADMYDFHAYVLTAPLLLIAFCFLEARRYGWLVLFLTLSAATKENAPLDAVPLGVYLAVVHRRRLLGLGAALGGLAWFGIATYLVVPRFNVEGQSWLWTRYGGMGGTPLGALQHFVTHPELLLAPVPSDPNWRYLTLLTAPVAGLTLLSPSALFLMGPALAVNVLTDYEPMHLLETYHYSAHLVPYVILGAVYATGTLTRLAKLARLPARSFQGVLGAVVLASTLVYQHYRGYTPLSGEFVGYPVTAHDRLGIALAQQLDRSTPDGVAVSAQGNLYPHVDHRSLIFMFPEVDVADIIFLDVATLPNTTGINEGIHGQVRQVLDGGAFGPSEAVDGYLILRRGAPRLPLPDAFFSFARAGAPAIQHPLRARFGDALELLGFDVLPDRDGKVNLRDYWEADRPIQQDLFLPFFITDGQGHEVGATLQREPANFWYPTNRWKPGEIVQITTYNLPIGRRGQDFGIALGAQANDNPWNTGGRLSPVLLDAPAPLRTPGQGALLEVLAYHNDHDLLTPVVPPLTPAARPDRPLDVAFDEGVRLAGYSVAVEKGKTARLTLFWQASGATSIPYTVFAHLLDRDGLLVAQHDSPPAGGLKATTAWLKGETIVDDRAIPLPADVDPSGTRLELGLYDPVSGSRLPAHVAGQMVDHVVLPVTSDE